MADIPRNQAAKPRRRRRWWGLLAGLVLLLVIPLGLGDAFVEVRRGRARTELEKVMARLDEEEPGWRLAELESAREVLPEGENSARVALACKRQMPKGWPTWEACDALRSCRPECQLSGRQYGILCGELDRARPAIEFGRRLADMPRGRYEIEYAGPRTIIQDEYNGASVGFLLDWEGMRCAEEGDLREALRFCRAGLNARRSIGDEPVLSSQQMHRGHLGQPTARLAERILARGEPPADELETLQQLAEQEDAFPDLETALRGARALLHETLLGVERADYFPAELCPCLGPQSRGVLEDWLGREIVRGWHPDLLSLLTRWVRTTRLPPAEQLEAQREAEREYPRVWTELPGLMREPLPHLPRVFLRSREKHAHLRCLIVALATERQRQETGAWPTRLEDLCPRWLAAVPLDPFDAKPLRYARCEDGVVIYSVGPDETDDGGLMPCPSDPSRAGTDLGILLWPPSRRGLPGRPAFLP